MDAKQFFPERITKLEGNELVEVKAKNASKGMPKRLKDLREEKKLSQKELAKLLGVKTAQTISAYENGTNLPDAITIRKYAETFGVSCDFILGINDAKDIGLNEAVNKSKLSELSMYQLSSVMGESKCKKIINKLFEDAQFYEVLKKIVQYVYTFDDLQEEEFENSNVFRIYNLTDIMLPSVSCAYDTYGHFHKTDILMDTVTYTLRTILDRIKKNDERMLREETVRDIHNQIADVSCYRNPLRNKYLVEAWSKKIDFPEYDEE